MTYIITIENDMKQQLVFHAANISEALDKAKIAFKESMVTAFDSNGEQRKKPLSEFPKVINLTPNRIPHSDKPKAIDKEHQRQQLFNTIPD